MMNISRIREITFEIPVLMTEEEGQYMIMSKELAIFVQDSNEQSAKKLFERSLDILLEKWFNENRMIDQLRLHGFLVGDRNVIDKLTNKPKYEMPNLELGRHSKIKAYA